MDTRRTYACRPRLLLLGAGSLALLAFCVGCTPAPKFRAHAVPIDVRENSGGAAQDTADAPWLDLVPPVDGFSAGRITSPYGLRGGAGGRGAESHEGIDIKARPGETVRAAAAGTVVFSGRQRGYGNVVKIDHGNGFATVYAHLFYSSVRMGERVGAGDAIGRAGKRGRATGTHLHFEVRYRGTPLDPMRYLGACLRAS